MLLFVSEHIGNLIWGNPRRNLGALSQMDCGTHNPWMKLCFSVTQVLVLMIHPASQFST